MTYTLNSGSFIELNIDTDFNEVVIDNVKSMKKGEGTILVQWAIEYWRENCEGMDLTLYAYPQDETIDQEGLVAFWLKQGFEIDSTNDAGEGTAMRY